MKRGEEYIKDVKTYKVGLGRWASFACDLDWIRKKSEIVKKIKDSGLKAQASIMDEQVRVQAKKIDDLQAVITLCRQEDFGQPLQYINMRD